MPLSELLARDTPPPSPNPPGSARREGPLLTLASPCNPPKRSTSAPVSSPSPHLPAWRSIKCCQRSAPSALQCGRPCCRRLHEWPCPAFFGVPSNVRSAVVSRYYAWLLVPKNLVHVPRFSREISFQSGKIRRTYMHVSSPVYVAGNGSSSALGDIGFGVGLGLAFCTSGTSGLVLIAVLGAIQGLVSTKYIFDCRKLSLLRYQLEIAAIYNHALVHFLGHSVPRLGRRQRSRTPLELWTG